MAYFFQSTRAVLTAIALLIVTSAYPAFAGQCPQLEGKSSEQLTGYLRSDRMQLEPACILSAMRQLGDRKDVSAVPTLLTYLDFRQPVTRDYGFHLTSRYPVETALFQIGKPAVPALLQVLATADPQSVAAATAVSSLMLIYRDSLTGAVALLREQADRTSDTETAMRFEAAGKQAIRLCYGAEKPACETALFTRPR